MEDEDITDMIIDSRDVGDDLTTPDLRDKEIEKRLKEYYNNLIIKVEHTNKDTYRIHLKTKIRTIEYGSNFSYEWDKKATIEANIREIKHIIKKIIINFFEKELG